MALLIAWVLGCGFWAAAVLFETNEPRWVLVFVPFWPAVWPVTRVWWAVRDWRRRKQAARAARGKA